MRYRFYDRLFDSEQELIETLLAEAREQIINIESMVLQNTNEHRIQIKSRLRAISHYINHPSFENIKETYNTLWGQVYRLEHVICFCHPYIKSIQDQICKINIESNKNLF